MLRLGFAELVPRLGKDNRGLGISFSLTWAKTCLNDLSPDCNHSRSRGSGCCMAFLARV